MPRKTTIAGLPQAREVDSVAAYGRVSTDEQRISGLGIDAQRTRCRGMAEAKLWPAPVFYIDEGLSGTREAARRPALQALLEALRAGKHQAVILPSLDRLGRKTKLILDLVDEIGQHALLISCKEALDTTTPQGHFVLTIFAGIAQLERDLIAQRTKAALEELSKKTGDQGGRIPYGYFRAPEGVKIDRQRALIVRRIFRLHMRRMSLRQIARAINALGVPGPRGGVWYHTTIREILANRDAYLGGPRGASQIHWPTILKPAEAIAS